MPAPDLFGVDGTSHHEGPHRSYHQTRDNRDHGLHQDDVPFVAVGNRMDHVRNDEQGDSDACDGAGEVDAGEGIGRRHISMTSSMKAMAAITISMEIMMLTIIVGLPP